MEKISLAIQIIILYFVFRIYFEISKVLRDARVRAAITQRTLESFRAKLLAAKKEKRT